MQEKFKLFRFWEGHRSTSAERASFQVRKLFGIFSRYYYSSYEAVGVGLDKNQSFGYIIESYRTRKSPFKMLDKFGKSIAEVKSFTLDI